jgi:hypothetical protein
MIDTDGKPFSTAVTGLVTLATCYIAGWTDWALLALPLLIMVAFWLAFRSPALPTDQPATTARSGVVLAARGAAREIIFAEFERAMIQERARAGLARALMKARH